MSAARSPEGALSNSVRHSAVNTPAAILKIGMDGRARFP
jgi:hypothetical protein